MSLSTRKHFHPDRVVRELAEDHAENARILKELGFLEGVLVAGIEFTAATAIDVAHKLRRKPTGWRVMRAIGGDPALFCTDQNWRDRTAEFLTLTPGRTSTADVYFF